MHHRLARSITLVLFLAGATACRPGASRQAGVEYYPVPVIAGQAPRPFSSAVRVGSMLYLSGQIGTDGTGQLVPGGIEAETRQTLENVGVLLRAVGLDYGDVVRCTVYIVDFDEFAAMNAVYREYFPSEPPTRATVGVTRLAGDYRIEIEVVAAR